MNEQSVVIYCRDGEDRVYDTAYEPESAKQAVRRCVERHGNFADVRVSPAKDFALRQYRKRPL